MHAVVSDFSAEVPVLNVTHPGGMESNSLAGSSGGFPDAVCAGPVQQRIVYFLEGITEILAGNRQAGT